jgi:hypothetical protein
MLKVTNGIGPKKIVENLEQINTEQEQKITIPKYADVRNYLGNFFKT